MLIITHFQKTGEENTKREMDELRRQVRLLEDELKRKRQTAEKPYEQKKESPREPPAKVIYNWSS